MYVMIRMRKITGPRISTGTVWITPLTSRGPG
jgi:hypothetical protein